MAGSVSGQPIGRNLKRVAVSPVITASSAYSAGMTLGAVMTFAGMAFRATASGLIVSCVVVDKVKQSSQMDLILFNALPSVLADRATYAPTAADILNIVGVIPIVTANWLTSFSANSVAQLLTNVPYDLGGSNTDLYGQLVCRGTPTYASVSDLQVSLQAHMD